jgi:hypothetical protein
MKKVSAATKLSFNEKEGKVRFTHMCIIYLRLFCVKLHSLLSFPFQGVKKSRLSGPIPSNGPRNGICLHHGVISAHVGWLGGGEGHLLTFGEGKRIWSYRTVFIKEVIKEQPPARNLSAEVRQVLQVTNAAIQRPPFWSGLKSTNPAISSQIKRAVFCWLGRLSRLNLGPNGGLCFLTHSTDCTLLLVEKRS